MTIDGVSLLEKLEPVIEIGLFLIICFAVSMTIKIIISMLHNKLNTQQRKKGEKLVEAKAIQTTETPNKDSVDNTSPAPVENNNQRTKRGKTKRYNINYKKIKESQKVLDKIFKKKMAVVNKKIKEKKKEPVA